MAIGYVTGGEVINTATAAGDDSASFDSGTSGIDRYLLVVVQNEWQSSATTAVTYNGVSMTKVVEEEIATNSSTRLQLWALANPSTGSNTLALTGNGSGSDLIVTAWVYSGVSGVGATAKDNAVDATPAISVTTTAANSWVFSAFGARNANIGPFTPDANIDVERLDVGSDPTFGEAQIICDSSEGSAGSVTHSGTWTGPSLNPGYAVIIAELLEVSNPSHPISSGYYVEVTIPVAQVHGSTNLTDFPVLLTRDSGSSSGDWDDLFDPSGTPAATNGTDIRCADSTGTQIACEVVSYSPDTTTGGNDGSLELWVKVPTLNATGTPTTIRVYWDGTTSSAETATGVTAADVWSDRKFQCFPRNTTEAVKNRTGLSPDGTLINPSNFLTTTIFGFDALRRANSICGVEFPDDPDLDGYGDDITVQILALFGSRNGFHVPIMKGTGGVPNSRAYSLQFRRLSSSTNYELFLEVDSTNNSADRFSDPNPPQVESIEALITVVQDNDNIKFYFNDSLEGDKTRLTDLNVPSKNEPLRLFYDGDLNYGTVSLASVSVWDTPRTAEQIYTEYNNLSSPSTFATPGAKTTLGAGGGATVNASTATVTVTANSQTIVVTPASNLPTQGFYATIPIDRTQVPGTGTRTNFAALFTRDTLPDDMFDPSGSPCRTDGGDIRASNSNGSVQFPVDVISCGNDTTTGAADASVEFWVKVDSVNTAALGSNTEIRIYWGDSSYTAQPAATDTYGRNEVWTEYEAVYRFNDNATITDRTGNGRDLTVFGSPTVSTTGQAWGENCIAFAGSGSGDYAISPDTFSTSVAFTVNVVFDNYVPANSGPYSRFIEFGGYATGDGGVGLERSASSTSTTTLSYPHYTAGGASSTSVTVSNVNPNWFNSSAQAVDTSNSAILYVNGSFLKTHSSLRADSSSAALVFGGDARETGNNTDYDVTFAYIGKTNFSAEWIATEYNNQSSPSTFFDTASTTVTDQNSASGISVSATSATTSYTPNTQTIAVEVLLSHNNASVTYSGNSQSITLPGDFPTVVDITETSGVTPTSPATNALVVDMPASVTAGNILLMAVAIPDGWTSGSAYTTPSGWTELENPLATFNETFYPNLVLYAKTADGTEGGTTVSISLGAYLPGNSYWAAQVWQISDTFGGLGTNAIFADGLSGSVGSIFFAETTAFDLPTFSDPSLWIGFVAIADDKATVTAWPSNGPDNQTYTVDPTSDAADNVAALISFSDKQTGNTYASGNGSLNELELRSYIVVAVRGVEDGTINLTTAEVTYTANSHSIEAPIVVSAASQAVSYTPNAQTILVGVAFETAGELYTQRWYPTGFTNTSDGDLAFVFQSANNDTLIYQASHATNGLDDINTSTWSQGAISPRFLVAPNQPPSTWSFVNTVSYLELTHSGGGTVELDTVEVGGVNQGAVTLDNETVTYEVFTSSTDPWDGVLILAVPSSATFDYQLHGFFTTGAPQTLDATIYVEQRWQFQGNVLNYQTYAATIDVGVSVATVADAVTYTPNTQQIGAGISFTSINDALTYTPNSHTVEVGASLSVTNAPVTYTGNSQQIDVAEFVEATSQAVTYTANAQTILVGVSVETQPPNIQYLPRAAGILVGAFIAANSATVNVQANPLEIAAGVAVSATSTSITYAENAQDIDVGLALTTVAADVTYNGRNQAISTGNTITTAALEVTYTQNVQAVSPGIIVNSVSDEVTYAPNAHGIDIGVTVSGDSDAITYVQNSQSLDVGAFISAATAEATYTSYQQQLILGDTLVTSVAEVTYTGNAHSVIAGVLFETTQDAVSYTGNAHGVEVPAVVSADAATIQYQTSLQNIEVGTLVAGSAGEITYTQNPHGVSVGNTVAALDAGITYQPRPQAIFVGVVIDSTEGSIAYTAYAQNIDVGVLIAQTSQDVLYSTNATNIHAGIAALTTTASLAYTTYQHTIAFELTLEAIMAKLQEICDKLEDIENAQLTIQDIRDALGLTSTDGDCSIDDQLKNILAMILANRCS